MKWLMYVLVLVTLFGSASSSLGQIAPPPPDPVSPSPGIEAVERLIAEGERLQLNVEKDGKPNQFLVRLSLHPAANEEVHPNPLSVVAGRDKEKCFCLLYSSVTRLPLMYSTSGFTVMVSTSTPGKLEIHDGAPQFAIEGDLPNKSLSYNVGLANNEKFNVDMAGVLKSMLPTVRAASLTQRRLTLILTTTRMQIDLADQTAPNDFPIREMRLYSSDQNGKPYLEPAMAAAFSLTPPAGGYFAIHAENVKKLKTEGIVEISGIGRVMSVATVKDYFLGDLGNPKLLAAARELATLLPPLPDPIETPETGPATKTAPATQLERPGK